MVKRKARALTRDTRQTGSSDLLRDRKLKALAPGKRRSKNGIIYYENRKNRSDVKGVDAPRLVKKKRIVPKVNRKNRSDVKGVDVTPSKRVAVEILRQLGGRGFMRMTGANQFLSGKNWMAFKLPRAMDGNRRVKISLNSMDTYDIKFMSLSGKTNKIVKGIYNDQLKEIISRYTGLSLTMPRVRFR